MISKLTIITWAGWSSRLAPRRHISSRNWAAPNFRPQYLHSGTLPSGHAPMARHSQQVHDFVEDRAYLSERHQRCVWCLTFCCTGIDSKHSIWPGKATTVLEHSWAHICFARQDVGLDSEESIWTRKSTAVSWQCCSHCLSAIAGISIIRSVYGEGRWRTYVMRFWSIFVEVEWCLGMWCFEGNSDVALGKISGWCRVGMEDLICRQIAMETAWCIVEVSVKSSIEDSIEQSGWITYCEDFVWRMIGHSKYFPFHWVTDKHTLSVIVLNEFILLITNFQLQLLCNKQISRTSLPCLRFSIIKHSIFPSPAYLP